MDDIVRGVKSCGYVTINDYRLLTGACREGINQFLKSKKKTRVGKLSISQVLLLTKGYYGHEKMVELFT